MFIELILFQNSQAKTNLVLPKDEKISTLIATTVNEYLNNSFDVVLPTSKNITPGKNNLIFLFSDNDQYNLNLPPNTIDGSNLGEEGFGIVSFPEDKLTNVYVIANTLTGLVYGAQELVLFRLSATEKVGIIRLPINVIRKPQIPYRGIYILPCWAAYDTLESWLRVLRFCTELTLNRFWFWLDGFGFGKYPNLIVPDKVDLTDENKVRQLIKYTRLNRIKFYLGGGWYTWYHQHYVGNDENKGKQYYQDMLNTYSEVDGLYLEPTGETVQVPTWRNQVKSLSKLVESIGTKNPKFEFAIAMGKNNSPEYRAAVKRIKHSRLYWWWCWGDPYKPEILNEYPLLLRWHTIRNMTDYHGSTFPPEPRDLNLTGVVTSYDPGMGFGNIWDGWGKVEPGTKPRNFNPYSIPYFAIEYLYRERCWNVNLTPAEFKLRLFHRLFDANVPTMAIDIYLDLTEMVHTQFDTGTFNEIKVEQIKLFVEQYKNTGSLRMRYTIQQMENAIAHF